MKQGLEIITGRSGIAHYKTGLQIGGTESHGICKSKLVGPVGVADHTVRKAKVELDRGVATAVGKCGGL